MLAVGPAAASLARVLPLQYHGGAPLCTRPLLGPRPTHANCGAAACAAAAAARAQALFKLSVDFRKEETRFLNKVEQQKGLEQGSVIGIIEADEGTR